MSSLRVTPGVAHEARPIGTPIDRGLPADLLILAVLGAYVGLVAIGALALDGRAAFEFGTEGLMIFSAFALVGGCSSMWGLLRAGHSMSNASTWRTWLRRVTWPAVVRYLTACGLIWPFLDAFGWVKSNIGTFQEYRWDPVLVRVDAVLHGGHHPGVALMSAIGSTRLVDILDWIYHPLWMFAFTSFIVWFGIIERNSVRRQQALLSYIAIWIVLGSVLAAAFASVGPCFYGSWAAGPDPFEPLMDRLRNIHSDVHLFSFMSQAFLWSGFNGDVVPLGISAMPSVHIGLTLLMALSLNGVWRLLGGIFLIAVFAGSVLLGWHYAVDGYISLVVTAGIWRISGRFSEVFHANHTSAEHPVSSDPVVRV